MDIWEYEIYQMHYRNVSPSDSLESTADVSTIGTGVLRKSVGSIMQSICHASTTPRGQGGNENENRLTLVNRLHRGRLFVRHYSCRYISRLMHIGSVSATRTTSRLGICSIQVGRSQLKSVMPMTAENSEGFNVGHAKWLSEKERLARMK